MSLLAADERLTRRVGMVSLAVIALAIVFFVFLYDRIEWGSHVRIRVYFHHVGSLREGAPFVVAGRAMGKVETIGFVERGASGPLRGDEGVMATVAIDGDDAAHLDRGGDVFIASRGALSERYLELGPAPEPGQTLRDGDQLLGRDPPSLDRVLQRTWDNLLTVGKFADEVKPELDALRAQLDHLRGHFSTTDTTAALPSVERLGPLIDDAQTIATQIQHARSVGLGGEAGMARIASVVAHAHAMLADTRTTLDRLGASAATLRTSMDGLRARLGTKGNAAIAAVELAIDRVRADIDKVEPLLAQVDALSQRIANGEGSLLKLMRDPEFPEDAKELGKILKRQPWKIVNHPSD